jgi:hypothetical protein
MKGWRLCAAMLFAVFCAACDGCDCGGNCSPTGPSTTPPTTNPPVTNHVSATYFACRNPVSQSPTAAPCAENQRLQLVNNGSTTITARRGEKISYDFWVLHSGDPNWLISYLVDAFDINPQTEVPVPQFGRSPETPPSPKRLIGKEVFVTNGAQVGEVRKIIFQAYNSQITKEDRVAFVDYVIRVQIVQ